MTIKSKELREQRAKLMKDAEALLVKETMSAEERTQVVKMHADGDELKAQYELIDANEAAQTELRESARRIAVAQPNTLAEETEKKLSGDPVERKQQVNAAFRDFLKSGKSEMRAENRVILETEKRTYAPLQVANSAAGYFVPQGFSFEFDEALKQTGGMFEAARVYATDSGNPLMWPKVDDTANKAVIVAEAGTVAGVNPTVDHTQLDAYKYGTLVQASIEQLEDSAFDIEGWLRGEFVTRFARGVNADLTTGNGTAKPNGITNAISTAFTTGANSAITYDDLVGLIHKVDPMYRRSLSARLMFNDATLSLIRLIKDSYGHPIFQTDPTSNLPDRILGHQYVINQDFDSLASAKTIGAFGDFSRYVIRKVNGLMVQRLNERYAEQGLVGFLGWARYDGDHISASTSDIALLTMKT